MFPLIILNQFKYLVISADPVMMVVLAAIAVAVIGNLLCAYFDWPWPKPKRS